MNFTTDPRKLASAVSWAARRVPSKPEQPILGGMLITMARESDVVSFSGFDGDVSTTANLTADDCHHIADRVVVSGRLLAELVKSLPAQPVTLAVDRDDDTYLDLTCGPVKATLPLMPAEDYPSLPTTPDNTGAVGMLDFAKQVGRVLPAYDMAGATGLPALTGMFLEFGDDHLRFAATNRYQMAVGSVRGFMLNPDAAEAIDLPVVVPGLVVADVLKVCDSDGALTIGTAENAISFSTAERTIVSRMLDVKGFPNFAARIPERDGTPTVVDVEEVVTALKRAAMVLDGPEPVTLDLGGYGGHLVMRAGSGKGQVTAELFSDHSGPEIALTVNPTYLITALTSLGHKHAELTITGPASPILVTAPDDDTYRHVLMPIRKPS